MWLLLIANVESLTVIWRCKRITCNTPFHICIFAVSSPPPKQNDDSMRHQGASAYTHFIYSHLVCSG